MPDMAKKTKKPAGDAPKPKKKTTNVGVPIALHERLKEYAKSLDRSVNWVVRRFLEKALEDAMKTPPAP